MIDMVEMLRGGTIRRLKSWSCDTHEDLGGTIDDSATCELMNQAADHIEAQQAEIRHLRHLLGLAEKAMPSDLRSYRGLRHKISAALAPDTEKEQGR